MNEETAVRNIRQYAHDLIHELRLLGSKKWDNLNREEYLDAMKALERVRNYEESPGGGHKNFCLYAVFFHASRIKKIAVFCDPDQMRFENVSYDQLKEAVDFLKQNKFAHVANA